MQLSRDQIIDALREAIEPLPWVNAMFLGGSDAFGRTDTLSDIDAVLIVEPGRVDDAFAACERALAAVSPIEIQHRIAEPAWHGHSQRFYRLRDAAPYHHVDLFIMTRGRAPFFNEVELHGRPVVLFDRGDVVRLGTVDPAALQRKLAERITALRERVGLFSCYVDKELDRGHALAALHFYQSVVLAALVEALRIHHCPARHDWGIRYAHIDLPPEVGAELEPLWFVRDAADLRIKAERALTWLQSALAELEAQRASDTGEDGA